MAYRPRSLKHEYEVYVEREIEDYKESVSRSVLLGIGDEAVASLASQQQLALTEILLWHEVDRLIALRLRMPKYATWRRRRLRALKEFSRPERWGLRPDGVLARAVTSAGEGHVLVAGVQQEGTSIYLAANGCAVTTLDTSEALVDRIITVAVSVGLTGMMRGFVTNLANWSPDIPINAVVCASEAFSALSAVERERAFALLQNATTPGGVHLVETSAPGEGDRAVPLEELEARYLGWETSVERDRQSMETFLARKNLA